MAIEIKVPVLGESITEATIGTWLKQVGESFNVDEPLVELETDKVSIEVPASVAGTLSEVMAKEGDNVEVGAVLGIITPGGGASAAKPAPSAAKSVAAKPSVEKSAPTSPSSSMPPSPAAGKLMKEKGLSADEISGSGKRGQILKSDVLDKQPATATPIAAPKAPTTPEDGEERIKMSRLRQTIARRLKEAQDTAAILTTFNEVDMGSVMDMRKKYKELFEKKHEVKLGFMGFFTKAVCQALKEIPSVNAQIDGTDLVYKKYCHIGVAVGTDKGLVVPVLRNAEKMSLADIEKGINALGAKARDGKLSMADMQGGSFTISNGGIYGSLMSTPILNAPQSGILGMHNIVQRPMVVNGEIVARPMMYLALSYDHRVVDGKEAVTFLVRVKESLEDPKRMILDL
ncbi:MAG: 2-oxoglutarate dehydrogenase complex dihydrolipoyllysine-residue succinyltransferase [Rhizobiaceae bacterium]|nr:2-oxoglutarate dehydrogenase complex dihydrolipoyllysine-residue succinyltransferase [Rhizobiaceae bacterium]